MNTSLAAIVLSTLLCSAAFCASATWHLVGQGEMHWTIFKLYKIELYSGDGKYKTDEFPQALNIQYQRNISAKQLIEATREQWEHIGFEHPDTEHWLEQLTTLWPDITKNDSLRFEVYPDMTNQFFFQGKSIGSIENPDFSRAFLSIWLSPKTSEPKLREQLIAATGEPKS